MFIPAGLLSETRFGDTKFFVQTEFAQRPQPRVTTTISIDGAVVEKVENIWDKLPQTEEDREKIETYLKKQHQQVLKTIKEKKGKLVSFEPGEVEENAYEDDTILRIREVLSHAQGVRGWVFFTEGARMTMHMISEPGNKDAEYFTEQIQILSSFLTSITPWGNFKGGVFTSLDSRMIFVPLKKHLVGVTLDPQADCGKLVKRIKSLT